jgi:hypothetical protein
MSEAKPCGVHNDEGRSDLRIGKSGIRANGAIIHQCAARDNLGPASNWDIRIAKPVIRSQMSHSQFCDLACAARRGILVTFTAGLCVVQRPKTIRHTLHRIKRLLIGQMGLVIYHAVASIVEGRRRLGELWARVLPWEILVTRRNRWRPGECQKKYGQEHCCSRRPARTRRTRDIRRYPAVH